MRKIYFLLFTVLLFSGVNAQLSGVKTIPGDYPTINAAVAALNTAGVGAGGVTFNVLAGHTETSTDSVYLKATGTATDQIIFQKSGAGANPRITRTGAGLLTTSTVGASGDAVVIIEGSDYVTFNGIDVATDNQGVEYGYFIRKSSANDGAKNVAIQNATIALTRGTSTYVVGIYVSNMLAGGSVSVATGVTVASIGGRNENITLSGNTIRNVFNGIMLRGSTAFYDVNNRVGINGAGNIIENFGGTGTATSYGVYAIYQNDFNVGYNTINNMNGGGVAATGTFYGIFFTTNSGSNVTAEYNNINLTTAAASSALYGINNDATGAVALNNNNITLNNTGTSSGIFGYIYMSTTTASLSISNNIFTGSTFNTTGTTSLIYNNNSSSGSIVINNNATTGTINRTGASGTFYGYYNNGSPTGIEQFSNNNFSRITLAGTSAFYGVNSTTNAGNTQNIYNNSISGITAGSGTSYGFNLTVANTRNVYNNQIFDITGSGTIHGMSTGSGFTTGGIYQNKIYGLNALTASGIVYGITIAGGTAPLVYNNLIGDLRAPAASANDAIRGINITSSTTASNIKVYFNTVHIAASSTGTNFGTTGIFHTSSATATTATLDLRNNIIYNNSTAAGSGFVVAYRRSTTSLANYASTSNNNLFYAGVPSPTNLIFSDGTNSDQTLAAYQARVTPIDAASTTENVNFISTTGSSPSFLHINTTIPTRIESAGSTIAGITVDYDAELRHATTPDIGADEFTGTPLSGCSGMPSAGTITGSNFVCTGSSRTLMLSGHTADAGITYQWRSSTTAGGPYTVVAGATGSSYATPALTSPQYYVVDVTCTNTLQTATTSEFSIAINPLPVVSILPAAPAICIGTSTTLTASGASTYSWSPATNLSATTGATVTATPTVTRTYTVTGTDGNGCVNTATVTVTVNPIITGNATATPAVICMNGNSQLQANITDGVSYGLTPIAANALTSSGGATVLADNGAALVTLSNGDLEEGRWEKIPLPFSFKFYGASYDSINITTNGYATFGAITSNTGYNSTLPSTSVPNNAIHIVTADLDFRAPSTGRIEYFVEGVAPNRVFVINYVNGTFYNITTNTSPGTVTAQAILYEGSNIIEIHTSELSNTLKNKAQGIENPTGTFATVVPGRNNTPTWSGVPDAYRFTPNSVNYSWSPATFLNNASISNPLASNVTATTTYNVTMTDAVTGCSGSASVTLTAGTPLGVTATNTNSAPCIGNSVTMNATATGGGLPYTYSWSDGSTVVSTSASFTATPSATTTYTVTVTDACANTATASTTITVNNPTVTGTTPATRCGIGTTTLQATGASGTTLNWYNASTGGNLLGTGNTFTTPTINSSTTYYVGASAGGSIINTGRLVPQAGSGTNLATYGQDFTITAIANLNSVDVISTTGTSITISLYSAGGTTQLQTTGALTVPAGSTSTIALGWSLAPGTYRLVANGMTGNFIRENTTVSYPIALGQVGQINGFVSTITGSVSTSSSYYFMYNWNMFIPCEGIRVPVTATVNTPPAITVAASNNTICNGQSTTLTVSSPNSGYSYTWNPGSLTGASVSVSPSANTKYYVNAVDASGGPSDQCAAMDSISITVNPIPGTVNITAASPAVCPGGTVNLSVVTGTEGTVTIGTGTSTNTTSTPYRGNWGGSKTQIIYTKADLIAMGLQAGSTINQIGHKIASFTSPYTFNDFTIALKLTTATSVTSVMQTGTTTVFGPVNYTLSGTAPFTVTHTLSTPFVWDGLSNLLVETCFNNVDGGGLTANSASVYSTSTSATLTSYYSGDNNATVCSAPGTANVSTTRPNLVLSYTNAADFIWSPASSLYMDAAATIPYSGTPATTVYAKPSVATVYTATATNMYGCTLSGTTSIGVNEIPAISTQPVASTVCAGTAASFTVTATGTSLTYQWQKDNVDIAGATAATYTIASTATTDAGTYKVIVSGACAPAVTSSAVSLTINTAPVVVSITSDTTVCEGTNPSLSVNATGTNLSYQWRFGGANIAGANASTYTISNFATANAGAYDVVVSGTCAPSATSTVVNVTMVASASISAQPVSQAICPGNGVTFTVTAANASGYQWMKDGVAISGANASSLTIASVAAADAGNYTVVISGNSPCGTITSAAAVLSLNAVPAITAQPVSQTICANNPVTFSVSATGTGLTYQWRRNGTDISGATASSYTISSVVAGDAGNYDVVITGTCAPAVTSAAAVLTINGAPVINTQPSSVTVCQGAAASFTVNASGSGLTYQWRKGGVNITGATAATYTIASTTTANAGSYDVVITSSCATTSTSAAVTLTVNAPAAITVQPTSQTTCNGSAATFNVTATGAGLTYQWRKAGVNIAGANGSSFTISNVSASDIANYDVVITGICGSPATSNSVALALSATNTWLGTVSSNWNAAANWCSGVPTSTTDVLIPSGTAFPAILNANGDVRNLTVGTGASFSIIAGGNLNIYGNYSSTGTVTATAGTVSFRGATAQTVSALSAGYIVMNGTGGITLTGNMTAGTGLTLTNGNITLGTSNLTVNGGTSGSIASHIITNGTGVVSSTVGTASVIFPVGPDAATYNPVMIANGSNRVFNVLVKTGITPNIGLSARAINRTWVIVPATASATPAMVTFQYADTHANASSIPTATMEVGSHNGTLWSLVSPSNGVIPTGSATARLVATSTASFGPMVIANTGSVLGLVATPSLDADITESVLMPNLVKDMTVLRVRARRSMNVNWTLTDASGRVVMNFNRMLNAGQTDIRLYMGHLANGNYQLNGFTTKGKLATIRLIRY